MLQFLISILTFDTWVFFGPRLMGYFGLSCIYKSQFPITIREKWNKLSMWLWVSFPFKKKGRMVVTKTNSISVTDEKLTSLYTKTHKKKPTANQPEPRNELKNFLESLCCFSIQTKVSWFKSTCTHSKLMKTRYTPRVMK